MNRTNILTIALMSLLSLPARAEDAALKQRLARAAVEQAPAFQAVAALRAKMPEWDKRRRGPFAVVGPELKSLGSPALMPLLDEVVRGIPAGPGWTAEARRGWAIGVLEALGVLGDLQARGPVVDLLARESDLPVVRASAAALSRIAGPEALPVLLPLAEQPGERQIPAISGLADCRHLAAVKALTRLLAARPEEPVARAVAKSLGNIANAWAWQTESLASRSDRAAIRVTVAAALVDGFVAYRGEGREAFERSLMIIAAPETAALVQQAQDRAPGEAAALQGLVARLAASPVK